MEKLPNQKQRQIIAELVSHDGAVILKDGVLADSRGDEVSIKATALIPMVEQEWLDVDSDGRVTVTAKGVGEAEDAEALVLFRKDAPDFIQVTMRARGRSPIRGGGPVPKGRNVICRPCGKAAHAAGRSFFGSNVVWFTNESGAEAGWSAKLAAARHYRRHVSGDLKSV